MQQLLLYTTFLLFLFSVSLLSPMSWAVGVQLLIKIDRPTHDITIYECDYTMHYNCFSRIHVHSTIFCGHTFGNMYKLSVTVIDKPSPGAVYAWTSMFMPYLCTTEIKDSKLNVVTRFSLLVLTLTYITSY